MKREELSKLTLTELRQLARKQGVPDAEHLRREQIIAKLMQSKPAPTNGSRPRARSKSPKSRAASTRSARAAAPARPRTTRAPSKDRKSASADKAGAPPPVMPEPTETETMAQLYERQGHRDRAIEIYRRLLARNPARADLEERLRTLQESSPPAAQPALVVAPKSASEPTGMLDYEELPDVYGVDEVGVIAKDPWWLLIYWEVTSEGRASARAQLGSEAHAARLVLRIHSVEVQAGEPAAQDRDLPLDWDHGHRFVETPRPDIRVCVAVGLRAPSGRFAPIAHSPLIRVPRIDPGPEGPTQWMEVAPTRTRGLSFEPIVIVTRGSEKVVRGIEAAWDAELWHHPGSRVPLPPELGKPLERGSLSSPSASRQKFSGIP